MRYLRDLLAIVASILLIGTVPFYGQPFTGCAKADFVFNYSDCNAWPEFLRGVLFMLPLVFVSFHRWQLAAIGIIVAVFLTIVGGVESLRVGEARDYFSLHITDFVMHITNPFLLGALSVFLLGLVYFLKIKW